MKFVSAVSTSITFGIHLIGIREYDDYSLVWENARRLRPMSLNVVKASMRSEGTFNKSAF